MVSQLNQVYVDVGSQQMQARQRGRACHANMGQKLFPMLSSLHAYIWLPLFPVVMHFLGCADEIPKPVKKNYNRFFPLISLLESFLKGPNNISDTALLKI